MKTHLNGFRGGLMFLAAMFRTRDQDAPYRNRLRPQTVFGATEKNSGGGGHGGGLLTLLENAKAKVENVLGLANVLEPGEGGEQWIQVSPYGDFPHARGIQRMDRVAAENMVTEFETARRSKGRRFVGAPVYVGHPDVPHRKAEFPDQKAYGWVQELRVENDGLMGRVKWSAAGKTLAADGHYKFFSPYWGAEEAGWIGGKKLLKPVELVSIGLTNDPNIPVLPLANDKGTKMEKTILIGLLGLANDATDAQIEEAIKANRAAAGRVTALENDKNKAVQDLELERTAHQTTKQTLENQFKGERQERITVLLDNAIADGRITPAQKPKWKTDLENSFEAKAPELLGLQPTVKTSSKTTDVGNRRVNLANEAERRATIQAEVSKKVSAGMDYDSAYAAVQREQKALFDQMQKPEIAR